MDAVQRIFLWVCAEVGTGNDECILLRTRKAKYEVRACNRYHLLNVALHLPTYVKTNSKYLVVKGGKDVRLTIIGKRHFNVRGDSYQ